MNKQLQEELLTIPEVAKRLRTTRTNVYKFLNMGKLKSVKMGKLRRVKVTDLDAFIRSLDDGGDDGTAAATEE